MSPEPRSKTREKKTAKEPQKATSKSTPMTTGSSVPSNAYNPISGTFHTLEITPASSPPLTQTTGRFRNIDEVDDHSTGAAADYDSLSNNGSWSGESEDHKDKLSPASLRPESIPGADSDKREKIRQKNERKHQRQKERRANELHDRCTGFIMSRKLEARVQQLVSMGFSSERATAALMMNEGKLEESIAWLFEAGEDVNKGKVNSTPNLKIDITEELARISDMELQFKCTKQEVERAVVMSEGDLDKAAESLSSLKVEPPLAKVEPPAKPPAVVRTVVQSDVTGKTAPPTKRVPIPSKVQQVEKRWPAVSGIPPAKGFSPPAVVMMQRPQSMKMGAAGMSSSPGVGAGWFQANGVDGYEQRQGGNRVPALSPASSLGLFCGTSASPIVDWGAAGTMAQFDYTNIDWSLDRGLGSTGLWASYKNGPGKGSGVAGGAEGGGSGSREWSSPFEGKDLFSLPRQFVSSPSR